MRMKIVSQSISNVNIGTYFKLSLFFLTGDRGILPMNCIYFNEINSPKFCENLRILFHNHV